MEITAEQGLHLRKERRLTCEEKERSLNPVLRPKIIEGPW